MAAAGGVNLRHGYPTPGPQNPTAQQVLDHVFFLSRTGWKEARENNKYDIVVIGTGPCGLAVVEGAIRKNKDVKILVIERGTFFIPDHFQNLAPPFLNMWTGGAQKAETFPWSIDSETHAGELGTIRWQHGMVPFFGGRSLVWSAWCPVPTVEEMNGFPQQLIDIIHDKDPEGNRVDGPNLTLAQELLGVRTVSEKSPEKIKVYAEVQKVLEERLHVFNDTKNPASQAPGFYRSEAAPIACKPVGDPNVGFKKFATPPDWVRLLDKYGANIDIVCDCTVEKIIRSTPLHKEDADLAAIALQTSRGVLQLKGAKLVLAMGTLPPATLIQNSFPSIAKKYKIGEQFSAHVITAIQCRVSACRLMGEKYKKIPKEDPDYLLGCQLGAMYVGGAAAKEGRCGGESKEHDFEKQYHMQLSAFAMHEESEEREVDLLRRHMPDMVAMADEEALKSSAGKVVFLAASLGELVKNDPGTFFKPNDQDCDITTNSILRIQSEDQATLSMWQSMDEEAISLLEDKLLVEEYWLVDADGVGKWHDKTEEGIHQKAAFRVDALVHESGTLHCDETETSPVDPENFKLRGTTNVFVTGGSLWPRAGSYNPTLAMVAFAYKLAGDIAGEPEKREEN